MIEFLSPILTDYTLRTVALGAIVLGVASGALGSFAVLRGQSLLGDAISHAALPGIALAFILTGSKAPLVLLIGAALAGWLGTLLIMAATTLTRTKYDSALGLMLSVFFGAGMVLLTFIQLGGGASQAGLDAFLFGQAATLLQRDVIVMAALGGTALVTMTIFWKEFKLLSFDPEYGSTIGFPVHWLDVLLTTMLVIAIVIGLQTVGVVLMSAMVVAPAAAARQWTNRLGLMVGIAMFFGAASGVAGALISSTTANLPTGPTIVLCVTALVVVSILFAPARGLLWDKLRRWRQSKKVRADVVLQHLGALAAQHGDLAHTHSTEAIELSAQEPVGARLEKLAQRGLVTETDEGEWALTSKGIDHLKETAPRFKIADKNAGEKTST